MKTTFRRLSVLLTALFGLAVIGLSVASPPAQAAAKASTSHATKSRGAMTAIKVSRDQVNKGANVKKGVNKSSRGPGDYFHVDNRTGYTIDIYVDGDYRGAVGPYGDLYIEDATGGDYTASAEAPGTDLTWGPRSFSTPYTWHLTD